MKTLLSHVGFTTRAPRIFASGTLAIVLTLALTGCKNDARNKVNDDPTGVYTLVSVDGKNVPANLAHEGAAMTVKSGSFTISADGRCRSLITFSIPPHPDVNREVKATYTQKGAELAMKWEGAGNTKGHIDGNQFTMTNEGMVFLYRK